VTNQSQPEPAMRRFKEDCWLFINTVDNLFLRGATAVLTIRLDEDVTNFVSFLRESLTSEQIVKRIVRTRSWPAMVVDAGQTVAGLIAAGALAGIGTPTSQLLEFGVRSKPEIAAAPIGSYEFEELFLVYINVMKSGIKQVTLGGYKE
jgi:hypothetical protein